MTDKKSKSSCPSKKINLFRDQIFSLDKNVHKKKQRNSISLP